MYVGFNLITLAAMVGQTSVIAIVFGLYSIAIYHAIIRAEERFLSAKFGADYEAYRAKVRRYI